MAGEGTPPGSARFHRAKHNPEFFQSKDRLRVDEKKSQKFRKRMQGEGTKVQARLFKNEEGRTIGYYGGIEEEEQEQKRHFPFVTATFSIGQTAILIYSIVMNGGFADPMVNPMIGPNSSTLTILGANVPALIKEGEFWRFTTPIALHAGIIHLGFNLLSQLRAAVPLEKEFGWWRILIVYMIGGIGGNLASAIFTPTSVSVGASSSLFAMLGLQLADLIINWADTDRPVRALIILVITIIISLALGLLPIVDNYSHIGGFIVGVFSGFIFLKSTRFGHCQKFLVVLGSFLLLVYMTAGFFVFYQDIDTSGDWCSWCKYLNCVPIADFCGEDQYINGTFTE
eukprot:CAMPEP_0113879678 /NCGR_PEP_ID=MMETSP0780_2-20120614/7367_1 /TAXON_ID=652834 /ORGANISM="Palpitomonas bilix" /LENGTH=340 /DNA_ID=CAMNT_0000866277 /DNA_START=362 /DNA_END=1384 /DNA_ORIENTATION=+ /assembly_acc=CAM_ASM_000599